MSVRFTSKDNMSFFDPTSNGEIEKLNSYVFIVVMVRYFPYVHKIKISALSPLISGCYGYGKIHTWISFGDSTWFALCRRRWFTSKIVVVKIHSKILWPHIQRSVTRKAGHHVPVFIDVHPSRCHGSRPHVHKKKTAISGCFGVLVGDIIREIQDRAWVKKI
jgi:hypothetical protein